MEYLPFSLTRLDEEYELFPFPVLFEGGCIGLEGTWFPLSMLELKFLFEPPNPTDDVCLPLLKPRPGPLDKLPEKNLF